MSQPQTPKKPVASYTVSRPKNIVFETHCSLDKLLRHKLHAVVALKIAARTYFITIKMEPVQYKLCTAHRPIIHFYFLSTFTVRYCI